jgi:hypothetical protein
VAGGPGEFSWPGAGVTVGVASSVLTGYWGAGGVRLGLVLRTGLRRRSFLLYPITAAGRGWSLFFPCD